MYLTYLVVVSAVVGIIQTDACETRSCPSGFAYNPFTCTCFHMIKSSRTWYDAKRYCENVGEHLAVLDSVESINWFKNLRQTDNDWKSGLVWIGGRRLNGKWRWYGRVSKEVVLGDWEQVQPDPNLDNYCIQVFDKSRAGNNVFENYKWDDTPCSSRLHFICEKY